MKRVIQTNMLSVTLGYEHLDVQGDNLTIRFRMDGAEDQIKRLWAHCGPNVHIAFVLNALAMRADPDPPGPEEAP